MAGLVPRPGPVSPPLPALLTLKLPQTYKGSTFLYWRRPRLKTLTVQNRPLGGKPSPKLSGFNLATCPQNEKLQVCIVSVNLR